MANPAASGSGLSKFLHPSMRLQSTDIQAVALWGVAATTTALWLIQELTEHFEAERKAAYAAEFTWDALKHLNKFPTVINSLYPHSRLIQTSCSCSSKLLMPHTWACYCRCLISSSCSLFSPCNQRCPSAYIRWLMRERNSALLYRLHCSLAVYFILFVSL